ncbi:MAG: Hpt domain-containing protein [Rhodothalassiaceae bacterium]
MSQRLDLQHLALMAEGDEALMQSVLENFKSSAQECLERMASARAPDAFAAAAHRLKGAARSVGAWSLAEAAAAAEQAGLEQAPHAALSRVQREHDLVTAEIKHRLLSAA